MQATDGDDDDVRYSITDNHPAAQLFYINPVTGILSVTSLLTQSPEKVIDVSTHDIVTGIIFVTPVDTDATEYP